MDRSFNLGKTMENLRQADDKDLKRVQEHIEQILRHRGQREIMIDMLERNFSHVSNHVRLLTEDHEELNYETLLRVHHSLRDFLTEVGSALYDLNA